MNKAQGALFTAEKSTKGMTAWAPEHWAVDAGWQQVVQGFLASAQGERLANFVHMRLAAGAVVYPPQPFRALALTPLHAVKVVILGQDPYHGAGQAEGLAFSVAQGVRPPPSLRNIFKELQREGLMEAGADALARSGSLEAWAQQGVLLLNTCLTVEEGQPASHAGKGWEILTDALLAHVAAKSPACVYLLWGAHAQAKTGLIERVAAQNDGDVLVLKANHPSPLSALRAPTPFIGCGHFQQAQAWLAAKNISLNWQFL